MKSLWQNLELVKSDMQNPVDMVKEQSAYLEEGTEGLLILSVNSFTKLGPPSTKVMSKQNVTADFKYKVSLNTAYLPDYKYYIFSMYYDITFYPLILYIPWSIADEINKEGEFNKIDSPEGRNYFRLESQEEFEQIMTAVFNSDILRKVMANLKIIINSEDESME